MDRSDLHDILLDILDSEHVYFQPPESVKLVYPCVIYKRDRLEADFANNEKYAHKTRYQVTTIDKSPELTWQNGIFNLPLCRHVRNFAAEGLNHDVFELYY